MIKKLNKDLIKAEAEQWNQEAMIKLSKHLSEC